MSLKTCVHCGATLGTEAVGLACADCAVWLGFGDTTCAAENAALRSLCAQLAGALGYAVNVLRLRIEEMEKKGDIPNHTRLVVANADEALAAARAAGIEVKP